MSGLAFAESYLRSQGWKQGQPLGKAGDGITQPIEAKAKNGRHGIGASATQIADRQYSSWWSDAFDQAASRVSLKAKTTGNSQKDPSGTSLSASKTLVTRKRSRSRTRRKTPCLESNGDEAAAQPTRVLDSVPQQRSLRGKPLKRRRKAYADGEGPPASIKVDEEHVKNEQPSAHALDKDFSTVVKSKKSRKIARQSIMAGIGSDRVR